MEERLPTAGQSPAELKRQLELERDGQPFLIHRDGDGRQRLTVVPQDRRLRIGRSPTADLPLAFDPEVSRLHAEIEHVAGEWLVVDDGLSSNGSFLNGERVGGRRRLRSGDLLKVGMTTLVFRNPAEDRGGIATEHSSRYPDRAALTEMQLAVLQALCRPVRMDSASGPATNVEIAAELHLSVGTVKAHLRALYEKFAVGDLPQTRKRIRLAELAVLSGAVSPRED